MANNSFVPKAPKRFVQRVSSRLNQTLSTTEGGKVLHTTGERETLVRTIVQLEAQSFTGQNAGAYNLVLVREPLGVQTITASTGESLDNDQGPDLLWQHSGSFPDVGMNTEIEVDLKSMRKLMPGDELVLRSISSQAGSVAIIGHITQFFKLA